MLSENEALHAANILENIVATMKPDQRVLHDGEITDKPIDYDKPISEWNDMDTWNNYSAGYDTLKSFAEFCRGSGGFIVH